MALKAAHICDFLHFWAFRDPPKVQESQFSWPIVSPADISRPFLRQSAAIATPLAYNERMRVLRGQFLLSSLGLLAMASACRCEQNRSTTRATGLSALVVRFDELSPPLEQRFGATGADSGEHSSGAESVIDAWREIAEANNNPADFHKFMYLLRGEAASIEAIRRRIRESVAGDLIRFRAGADLQLSFPHSAPSVAMRRTVRLILCDEYGPDEVSLALSMLRNWVPVTSRDFDDQLASYVAVLGAIQELASRGQDVSSLARSLPSDVGQPSWLVKAIGLFHYSNRNRLAVAIANGAELPKWLQFEDVRDVEAYFEIMNSVVTRARTGNLRLVQSALTAVVSEPGMRATTYLRRRLTDQTFQATLVACMSQMARAAFGVQSFAARNGEWPRRLNLADKLNPFTNRPISFSATVGGVATLGAPLDIQSARFWGIGPGSDRFWVRRGLIWRLTLPKTKSD